MGWTDTQALARAQYYLQQSGVPWTEDLSLHNFKEFYNKVVDVVADMSARQRESVPYEWAQRFAALGGDWDRRTKRDPTLLYVPRTAKHKAFHESNAFVRYLISANGIGKTLMCYMELIWCATGQRHYNGKRGHAAVISTGHEGYSRLVFDRKMYFGEDEDPYSPYIPEDGYWFHSFDKRGHTIRLACPECAEAGRPKLCSHVKEITCLSADSGKERLMGFTATRALADEHIPEDVWNEIVQRIIRVNGSLMVAATPLAGPDSWEVRQLYELWKKKPEQNWRDPADKSLGRFVDVFQISKYDCIGTHNGPTEVSIAMEKATLPESEFRVRVMGEPMPLGDSIFDLRELDDMEKAHARPASYGRLSVSGISVEALEWAEDMVWEPRTHSEETHYEGIYVWEPPQSGAAYVIGADVAEGGGGEHADASVAVVYKLLPQDNGSLKLEQVAKWFGHELIYEFAAEIKKLATYYNQALVVPEVTGIGRGLMQVLFRQLCYPAVFHGENASELTNAGPESYMGVRTNTQIKPLMIEALLQCVNQDIMIVRDKEAISECRTFQKTRTESGLNWRYAAARGAHDDHVMAMALVAYATLNNPDQVSAYALAPTTKPKQTDNHHRPKGRPGFFI